MQPRSAERGWGFGGGRKWWSEGESGWPVGASGDMLRTQRKEGGRCIFDGWDQWEERGARGGRRAAVGTKMRKWRVMIIDLTRLKSFDERDCEKRSMGARDQRLRVSDWVD